LDSQIYVAGKLLEKSEWTHSFWSHCMVY